MVDDGLRRVDEALRGVVRNAGGGKSCGGLEGEKRGFRLFAELTVGGSGGIADLIQALLQLYDLRAGCTPGQRHECGRRRVSWQWRGRSSGERRGCGGGEWRGRGSRHGISGAHSAEAAHEDQVQLWVGRVLRRWARTVRRRSDPHWYRRSLRRIDNSRTSTARPIPLSGVAWRVFWRIWTWDHPDNIFMKYMAQNG